MEASGQRRTFNPFNSEKRDQEFIYHFGKGPCFTPVAEDPQKLGGWKILVKNLPKGINENAILDFLRSDFQRSYADHHLQEGDIKSPVKILPSAQALTMQAFLTCKDETTARLIFRMLFLWAFPHILNLDKLWFLTISFVHGTHGVGQKEKAPPGPSA